LINPPKEIFKNVTHGTFYSKIIEQEIGYNIYLPSGYEEGGKRYPVFYHLHGWGGNESTDLRICDNKAYNKGDAIIVFPNATGENGYRDYKLPIETIIVNELIPFIDEQYRTEPNRNNRFLSGYSMGGAGAFYYAVKYPELFGSVTSYAGTFHHFLHADFPVGESPVKIPGLYECIMGDVSYFEENSILYMLKQNAKKICSNVRIKIYIGTADILFAENEIMHLYLDSLDIPHEYLVFEKVEHSLNQILQKVSAI